MVVVALDDTDSRQDGGCTTYRAARIADRLDERGVSVDRRLLVRLNPAVPHKTRGNAAVAVHVDRSAADLDLDAMFTIAQEELGAARTDDPDTHPGLVVADHDPVDAPDTVVTFARRAIRELLDLDEARSLIDAHGYRYRGWGVGRGLIGAVAAVGAWAAFDEWTYERLSYRESERRGTQRSVDEDSIFDAADAAYPAVWDTVDREEGETVCVPNAPGPVLHGIRGDDPAAVERVADAIESEPVERATTFVTNQGTDAHLRNATIDAVRDGRAYCVGGTVVEPPETRIGGHVFVTIADEDLPDPTTLDCVAFEPTRRFRDRVRALRVGDRITACGEIGRGTIKLEKFAVRHLRRTERVVPECPDCGRSMESAGVDQGYRCRACRTAATDKVEIRIERDLEVGWYEVPPCARRHIAKPLIRGGFDAPIHPER